MKFTMTDFKNTYSIKRRYDAHDLLIYYFFRPLSIYPSLLLANFSLSANVATYISVLFGIAAFVFFAMGGFQSSLIAFLFYFLFEIFDHVDGNLARLYKSCNYFGKYLDSMAGVLIDGPLPFIVAYGVARQNNFVDSSSLLLLGGASSIFMLLTFIIDIRLLSLRNEIKANVFRAADSAAVSAKANTQKRSLFAQLGDLILRLFQAINANVLFIFLFFSALLKTLPIYVIFSFVISACLLFFTLSHNLMLGSRVLNVKRTQ